VLEPQTRAALTEQLKPPSGYELSHAVGTTFTLDLATALAAPLSFASQRLSAQNDTLGVLDAIRRAADRVDVFAQAGEISMGSRSDLVAFLEPMVHPVAPTRGLFHPKVWFLEFRAGDRTAYRFLCGSRNLTGDRSWDVIVRLDGAPAPDARVTEAGSVNEPLVALLRQLPALTVHPISSTRRGRIDALAERWARVEWERPEPMKHISFHVFGVPGARVPDLRGQRALIISPFLSDAGLRALRSGIRTNTHLISRADSLNRLQPATLDARLSTYVLDDAATYSADDEDAASDRNAFVPPGERLTGLHAKAVIVDRQDGAHVLLGSANATDAGWQGNVEVMVELVGPVSQVGVETTLNALGDLKESYPTEGGDEPDAKEEAERRLEAFLRGIAGSRFSARIEPGDPYTLRVWADEAVTAAVAKRDGELTVSWHLLTRPDLGSRTIAAAEEDAVTLERIPLADITPFIVLIARDEADNERRTILLAGLLDDIASRQDAVIARQLTDRAAFVRLLTLLLELAGAWTFTPAGAGGPGFFGSADAADAGTGLFEALVRALGEGHHGLGDARRIIDFLREHGGDGVLPDGFEELWNQVWATHMQLTEGAS